MDRNFFIAMALSFLVLVGYQSFFIVPKEKEKIKNAQVVQNNTVTEKTTIPSLVTSEKSQKTTQVEKKEVKTVLKTPELNLNFTNMGGTLHKIEFNGSSYLFPATDLLVIKGLEEVPFQTIFQNSEAISYGYQDLQWKIVKTFTVNKDKSIKANIKMTNISSRLEEIEFKTLKVNVPSPEEHMGRNSMLDELSILEENKKIIRKGTSSKFTSKDNKLENKEATWVGYRDHFHMLLIKPEFESKAYENEVLNESQLSANIKPKKGIGPGETFSYDFTLVAGDQNIGWLKGFNRGFEKIVAFSNWWILDILGKAIYYTVPVLHSICHSWGLSIILVSILIYGLTYPLTYKSMMSMKKMQMVQPKIAALQKRYKGDPTKLNTEMVDLYRREGVNPLAGCLPFLLQMPIFIALYQVLWRAYYFQGKSFLWIKDLAQPDRLFILPFNIPFLGNEFNILPITMAGVMFLQQTLTAKNMVITDETQAMQQKMMKYIFPFFIGFMFYKFASGLSLYFTVFYGLSTWTQWKMGNQKTVSRENDAK